MNYLLFIYWQDFKFSSATNFKFALYLDMVMKADLSTSALYFNCSYWFCWRWISNSYLE